MALQNSLNGKIIVSGPDKLVARFSAGRGLSEEISCPAAARSFLAEDTVVGQRNTLQLGTLATVNTGTGSGQVPTLDTNGQWPASTIPPIALTGIQVVADSAARLALSNVQPGDVAKQSDNGISYILSATPASTASNWISIGDTNIDASEIVSGTLSTARGGTGLASIGSALQVLRVNAGGTALEYDSIGGGSVRLPYTQVSAVTQTLVADNSYGANNASQVVFTLPTTSAIGTEIQVVGVGAGGWRIAQNAGQQIHFGNLSTTSGTGGRLDSSHRRDSVNIKCVVPDLEWVVTQSVGNQDVV
jgi:hypothetical protein